jgi:hypothetical protein
VRLSEQAFDDFRSGASLRQYRPAASAPSLGPTPVSSSRPIILAICAMVVHGIILGFSPY